VVVGAGLAKLDLAFGWFSGRRRRSRQKSDGENAAEKRKISKEENWHGGSVPLPNQQILISASCLRISHTVAFSPILTWLLLNAGAFMWTSYRLIWLPKSGARLGFIR
jgi:hypothetical protein